jgi:fermentation-respiration switch protein FrsA (DUF1100 family)
MVAKILASAVALYLLLALLIAANERSFIYFPDRRRIAPETLGLTRIFERVIQARDGAQLIAWYMPAAPGRPTILYFHGNAGGLITRAARFAQFGDAGFGLFMPSYRGYSGSTGKPSEAAIIADAALAWASLIAEGVDPKDIVLYGESLGSGVAVQLAAQHVARDRVGSAFQLNRGCRRMAHAFPAGALTHERQIRICEAHSTGPRAALDHPWRARWHRPHPLWPQALRCGGRA